MKPIIVGVDFTAVDDVVLERAKNLALSLGHSLFLVHILEPLPTMVGFEMFTYPMMADTTREELAADRKRLAGLIDALKAEGVEATGKIDIGVPVDALLREADDNQAEMIIIGTHSRNFLDRVLLGSVAEGIVKNSKIPTLVVPTRHMGS